MLLSLKHICSNYKRKFKFQTFNYGSERKWKQCQNLQIMQHNENALQQCFDNQIPVVIKKYVSHWPAISSEKEKWKNLKQFQEKVKDYMVPVELGGDYMNKSTKILQMKFNDFIEIAINPEFANYNEHIYVAQTEVNELPNLIYDLSIPSICQFGKGTLYRKNIWFSNNYGAISPCHYDPFQKFYVK